MKTSYNGRKFIEQWEGFFSHAYDDFNDRVLREGEEPRGTLTIGFGHTSAAGPPRVYAGMVIDRETADRILSADLASVELEVNHLVRVPLNQNQFDALVSFQFNTGWLSHPHCSLLDALNKGRYDMAAEDFMLYDRAAGRVLVGLSRRREAEKKLFGTSAIVA